ncbi:MAG: helix-turn-helix transcriptional regulator, partial [Planctomycetota bacterium]|nr:helix-turn-helix transcriptional regulator [Planctomycetota bacterium]
ISFLETGRSRPSREMVLRLAEALELPLRERNRLLIAAGFAAIYGESSFGACELAVVRRALETLLQSHEPYPAFVVDRTWNVLLANSAHGWLLSRLLPGLDPDQPLNVMQLVLDPELLRPRIANWAEMAHVLGHRIRRQLRLPDQNAEERALLESLLGHRLDLVRLALVELLVHQGVVRHGLLDENRCGKTKPCGEERV